MSAEEIKWNLKHSIQNEAENKHPDEINGKLLAKWHILIPLFQ